MTTKTSSQTWHAIMTAPHCLQPGTYTCIASSQPIAREEMFIACIHCHGSYSPLDVHALLLFQAFLFIHTLHVISVRRLFGKRIFFLPVIQWRWYTVGLWLATKEIGAEIWSIRKWTALSRHCKGESQYCRHTCTYNFGLGMRLVNLSLTQMKQKQSCIYTLYSVVQRTSVNFHYHTVR